MSFIESSAAMSLCAPGMGSVYVRDDGKRAVIVSANRTHVFFRRDEDGELMRVKRDAFARRYRVEVANA